ncbi:MAG TPA: class F sortase [Aeromicrobium sp.]|nr:class F sortase [Aeromicrobium sp.]
MTGSRPAGVSKEWLRRKFVPWVAAPLSLLIVFAIGLAATWVPDGIPRVVTSDVGPTLGAIGEPVSLEIPSLKIEAPIVPIKLEGDQLNPPGDVKTVGWWDRSAQPGATNGQSLMTGHAVHTGGGVMNRLGDIRRGASVTVHSKNKSASYIVQSVFVWSKEDVAKHSEDLFEPDVHARRLVLVTCADWDGRAWDSNVIVFAQPV